MSKTAYANDLEFINDLIAHKLDKQPAAKKFANTVTTAIGTAITILSQIMLAPLELPDWVMWVALALTTLGTLLGVSNTKNGFSDSQITKLRQWQAEYLDKHHNLHDAADQATNDDAKHARRDDVENQTAADLDKQVFEHLRGDDK